ncbi:hypothetical protein AA106555_1101 [Neokomagataea thailandica NBRC 106555]|uniref:Uncharacterized protein n=2 Tax=Neokomagataea TaxID=1223423 RepID=A0A4Y6V2P8_9PROT|nr:MULTISPECIES: hypothetical protein [Neokomagataea]QDH24253.1 hypothetical protein D5366_02120 [Neokomagataea tanensis]GBR52954.1 hypothetical protein AA106555_1101 [Neokomagataea thailandica NBRC 106555]
MLDRLEKYLVTELVTPVAPAVRAFAAHLVKDMSTAPLGVVFYGSMLRKADPDGILDFYVVTETGRDVPGGMCARLANHFLPPNVFYAEYSYEGQAYRAKVAVLSRKQFAERTGPRSADTTLWARFCQPVRLVWVRDAEAADYILTLIARCVTTAAFWSGIFGADIGSKPATAFWDALFAQTYGSELRVEASGRGKSLLQGAEGRFTTILPLAWQRAGLAFARENDSYSVVLSEKQTRRAVKHWHAIKRFGKVRNVLRLIKAAFTFKDGATYLAWKIQRHTGIDLALSSFEQKHPLLCLPRLVRRYRHARRDSK